MNAPPVYPRTPYLGDDPTPFVGVHLAVEEKLDGANVALWLQDGRVRVMSRGGPESMDRAGQLGRLRAWAAERGEALQELGRGSTVIYGEWLWLRHGISYDCLPDWLVVLDLWTASGGLLPTSERNTRAGATGLTTPPVVGADVVLTAVEEAEALIGPSRWGPETAEGVVLRRADGRRCKVVRTDFTQRSDAEWAGPDSHNRLARRLSPM